MPTKKSSHSKPAQVKKPKVKVKKSGQKVKIRKSKTQKPIDLAKLFVIPEYQQSHGPGQYVSNFKNWFMENCNTALCRVRKLQQLYTSQNGQPHSSEIQQYQAEIKREKYAISNQLRKINRGDNVIHRRAAEIIKLIRQNNAQARRILDSLPGPELNPYDSDLERDPFEEDPTSIFNTNQVTDALRNYLHENIHVGGQSVRVRNQNKKKLVQFLRNFYIHKYRNKK